MTSDPKLPYRTSDQLSILTWRQGDAEALGVKVTSLDLSQASYSSVSQLDIKDAYIAFNHKVILQLASFERLTDLRLGYYRTRVDPDYELRPLTSLLR